MCSFIIRSIYTFFHFVKPFVAQRKERPRCPHSLLATTSLRNSWETGSGTFGDEAARARGRVGGRPRKLSTNGKVALALRLVEDPHHSIDDICSTLGISRSTLYRYVREAKKASRPSDLPA